VNNRDTNDHSAELVPLLCSKKQAAQRLNLSLRTIDNLIAFKELAVRRIGRRVLIPQSEIIKFARTDHQTRKAA